MAQSPIPIAVVGISCRFPGGAHDPEKLWQMLSEGRDAWSDVPSDRFNWTSFHHPNPDVQGVHNHRGGHFINQDVAAFDARFFGISPAEASAMDPQQRILLEVAYEAMENAGIPSENIQGSNTGVYIATFTHDYESIMLKDPHVMPKYTMTGIGQAILSNRISYVFDLKGPSLTLDTACSGSLVALHHACQSLRSGETDMVLTGGTNLILSPDVMIPMSLFHILNSDGKCYAFDSRGSGYGRGEGVAIVVLKRLDDALKAGDTIRAIIRNTGVGQDGKTSGITLPSGQAQQNLIRSVYRSAGLDPRDTSYVEAHGTGTVAGDITEINAIGRVFSSHRTVPLRVGSIKANIGHLESSSGIAGLIKAILTLEKGFIPPTPNVATLKDNMLLEDWNIKIPQKLEPWPRGALRRASVNSFGYGGTNAHVVLDAMHTTYHEKPEHNLNGQFTVNGHHTRDFYHERPEHNLNGQSTVNGHHTRDFYHERPEHNPNGHSAVDGEYNLNGQSAVNGHRKLNGQSAVNGHHTRDFYHERPERTPNGHSAVNGEYNMNGQSAVNGHLKLNGQSAVKGHHTRDINPLRQGYGTYPDGLIKNCELNKVVSRTKGVHGNANHDVSGNEEHEKCFNIKWMDQGSQLFAVTAKSEKSLRKALDNVREWVSSRKDSDVNVRNLAYTLTSRRSIMPWRHTFVASTYQDVMSSLNIKPSINRASSLCRVIFIFTGQGAQWFAMGGELIATSRVFTQSLSRSDRILQELGAPWSLLDELSLDKATSRVDQSEIGQPATTAIQIALVDLYHSLGVNPDVVVGHSSGEIAAAYAAGALTQDSALRVSYHRSFLARRSKKLSSTEGAMLAVGLGEKDVSTYISCLQTGVVVVACVNSPSSTTVSGDEAAIMELKGILENSSVSVRRLKVDTAYHSHHMKTVAQSYLQALDGLPSGKSQSVRFFSSVTGEVKAADFSPLYWVDNLVSKVRFSDALENVCFQLSGGHEEMAAAASDVFIEIGPHNALAGPTRETITRLRASDSSQFLCLPSLVRDRNAMHTILESTGKLFEKGYPVHLGCANSLDSSDQELAVIQGLAPYPWDHSASYWFESRLSKDHRLRPYPPHDLLGLRLVGCPLYEPVWRHVISVDSLPWLQEHVIDNSATFPASGYIAMAIEAKHQIIQARQTPGVVLKYVLRDVAFSKALIIPESPGSVELQLSFKGTKSTRATASWEDFRVSSISPDGIWSEHCHGSITAELASPADDFEVSRQREEVLAASAQEQRLHDPKGSETRKLDSQQLYQELQSKGNFYGPNFAIIKKLDLGAYKATGTVVIPDVAKSMPSSFMHPHIIHPATLDALIHSCLPIFAQHSDVGSVFTVGIGEFSISTSAVASPGKEIAFATSITPMGSSSATIDISAFQANSNYGQEIIITMTNAELRGVSEAQADTVVSLGGQDMTYGLEWAEDVDFRSPSVLEAGAPVECNGALSPERKLRLLNQAASLFIDSCLDRVTEDHVEGQHLEFFRWMKRFHSSYQSVGLIKGMLQSDIETCLQQAQHAGVEGEALCRVGRNLPSIVSHGLDPLSLMLDNDLLYRAYTDDASSRCYSHMVNFVNLVAFKRPDMVVLEIGAGTGGATLPLLEGLSRNGMLPLKRYDFTDVSPGFFDRARSLLQEWNRFVHFQALDIGLDPVEQGFAPGSYDLVIASNALHLTARIDDAIANVRRLLKPGGRLILVESTTVTPFVNMLYGIFPSWYCGVNDGRKDAPLLSTDQWRSSLLRGSFNGIELAANDYDGPAQRMTFIASRVVSHNTDSPLRTPISVIPIPNATVAHSAFSKQLVRVLQDKGLQASLAHLPVDGVTGGTVYVFVDDRDHPFLTNTTPMDFKEITSMLTRGRNLLWINVAHSSPATTDTDYSLVTGLARTARVENEKLKFVTLDMQHSTLGDSPDLAQKISDVVLMSFLITATERSDELEYVYSRGQLLIPRLIPDDKVNTLVKRATSKPGSETGLFHQPNRPLKLQVETPGLLDSFRFVDDDALQRPLKPFEVEIRVAASGLNFKDVIVALGQVKASIPMVGEYAGVVTGVGSDFKGKFKLGDRVCGWVGTPYASRARVHGYNAHRLPDSMPFSVGASIPIVFITAYHGLVELANLQRGQTVLIHAAAGGVGQAALKIAQHIGAEIFATVGNAAKRQFLRDTFHIPDDHIFSSRSGTFKKGVFRLTKGNGVDVVLNSLSGDLLRDSWACISRFGSFIEIGKSDIHSKSLISLEPFDKSVTFASVDVAAMSQLRPQANAKRISSIMSLFEAGTLSPIQPITTMAMTDIEDAFRLLQAGKQIGKVVLETDENTVVKVLPATPSPIELCSDATYVIAGGLGGLGLDIGRFMAARGAKHIALLSRRNPSSEERQILEKEFRLIGAKVHIVSCDISDRSQCRELVASRFRDMPPVRGVIQAAMVLHDRLLDQMDLHDFQAALRPKVLGTRYLSDTFGGPSLDFFIMLSSAVGILGTRGSANYAAGNTFQDAFANSQTTSGTHYVAIDLGPMKESGVIARNLKLEQMLSAQGVILLKNVELFALLEYSMSVQAQEDNCRQIVIGFNWESLSRANNEPMLKSSMLRHLPRVEGHQTGNENGPSSQVNTTSVSNARNGLEAQSIIARSIAQKISTLVVTDLENVEEDLPLVDFGLDSLVVIELKNWIARNFQATLLTSEISDAANISTLATKVAGKSVLVAKVLQNGDQCNTNQEKEGPTEPEAARGHDDSPHSAKLPQQPLPDLDDILQYFLVAASSISSGEDFEKTRANVREFAKIDGPGRRLHDRLTKRANDPHVGNWFSDIYLSHAFLQNRAPLSNFFGSHPDGQTRLQSAKRAAAISVAAFECKQMLEAGKIGASYLLDRALNTDSYPWLFNTCREPHGGEDRMRKYAGNDYLVAFRHGRPFKVMLREGSENVSYAKLKATFEAIQRNAQGDMSWVSILTADGRDEWAEYRECLKSVSDANATCLRVIEAAAFIVCLDDARPDSPSERAFQFFAGNCSNRWFDKSLQFIVCDNGSSATLCEHSMLDGNSILPIKDFISRVISERQFESHVNANDMRDDLNVEIAELVFSSTPRIDNRIEHIRRTSEVRASKYSFAGFDVDSVSTDIFRAHKCPPKSGVQLIVQLACYRFFGYNPPTMETVSMAHFRQGRVAVSQTVWPQVVDFSRAADNKSASVGDRRTLFFDAAKTLAKALTRAAKGYSITRYLLALEWMLLDDEPKPALFEDPTYVNSKTEKITTDCLENDLLECGGVLGEPGSLFIHFQVLDHRVLFSIWGHGVKAEEFRKHIERAAADVRVMLS